MFTLQITITNRKNGTDKEETFYTRMYKKAMVFSTDRCCAKKFKTMASAKGVATRLYKMYYNNPRFEMTGYEISIIDK